MGALYAALVVGDLERAERFYDRVRDQFGRGIMDDGWWYECSIGDDGWMAQLGTEMALALEPWGYNLKTMRIPVAFTKTCGLQPWQMQPGLYGMSFEKWGAVRRNYVQISDLWDGFLPFVDYRGVMFGANDSDETLIAGNLYELAYYAFGDPKYDMLRLSFGEEFERARAATHDVLDATDPNLKAFEARGGKIVMYYGWADPALNARMGVEYYEKMAETMGASSTNFYRLFMVPGMFHCRGGVGTDTFDALTPLTRWVEQGQAPDQIRAARLTNGKPVRTRPLCIHFFIHLFLHSILHSFLHSFISSFIHYFTVVLFL